MSNNVKIIPHIFHSLYTFDYFEPSLKDGAPEFLYADWPIINRIPKAAILGAGDGSGDDGGASTTSFLGARDVISNINGDKISILINNGGGNKGSIKKFESVMDVRKWIENKEDLKEEDYCENFIRIKKDDFVNFRQLFHGLIKHVKIEHKFDASLKVEGKGLSSPTSYVGVFESNPNPTDQNKGNSKGPCVDFVDGVTNKAIIPGSYNCGFGSDDKGEFSWSGGREIYTPHGPGPCYGAGGKSATAELKKCDKIKCHAGSWGGPNICTVSCVWIQKNFTDEEKETALDCCCPPEIEEDAPDNGGGNPSTTSSMGGPALGLNVDFKNRLDYIEKMAAVTLSNGMKWRDAKNYECSRSHKKIVKAAIIQDGAKIFTQSEFEKRIGGRDSKLRNIKDIEPPKENPSDEEDAYKKDAFTVINEEIFKNEWEFDQDKFKELFKSSRFPRNSTRINDPVFEYLIDKTSGQLKTSTYIDILAGFKKEGFLKGSKKINSEKLGQYTMEVSCSNISRDLDRDVVTYYFSLNLNDTAYIESTEEYLIFFDLNCKLDLGDISLSWNAGDYPTGKKDEDSGNYIESVYPIFKNDIPYDDIALFSSKKNFSAEEEKNENGKIVKIKIPINFVFESNVKDLEIECFRFEKKEAEVKDNFPCVKNKGKINWDLDKVKLQIHGWWQNDFKRGTSFPSPLT